MGEKGRFHLRRGYRVAAPENQFLLPPDDGDEAVEVDARQIARAEPAIAQDNRRFLRGTQIAVHDRRTLDEELTRLA